MSAVGNCILDTLNQVSASNNQSIFFAGELIRAANHLYNRDWVDLPSWDMIKEGARPPEPDPLDLSDGEWSHGWQFHASNALEYYERNSLLLRLSFPSWRRNARAAGKARLRSASGPFASTWMCICLSIIALSMSDRVFRLRYAAVWV